MEDQGLIRVATVYSPFPEKFGIPRQSGMEESLRSEVRLEGVFRTPDAVRGLEEYSHIWLIWGFSETPWAGNLTVSPPRLGGKEKKGVFATRAPYRPNSLGLSCVKLEEIRQEPEGPVLVVSGADLLSGTPVYDIKPYLPYTDSRPDASGGFGEAHKKDRIFVDFPEELRAALPEHLREAAAELLAMDPRAAFQKEPDFVYGMALEGFDIRFVAEAGGLRVIAVTPAAAPKVK